MSGRTITGVAYPVGDVLSRQRVYSLEFYQRKYAWTREQVDALMSDLLSSFFSDYDPSHDREQGAAYGEYFLGPIISTEREGVRYLIDGQQRLTTLMLLMIKLLERTTEDALRTDLRSAVVKERHGRRRFTLDVEERRACMEALLDGRAYEPDHLEPSEHQLVDRASDIADNIADLEDDAIPFFVEWLLDRVVLVEISTPERTDAYTIFETMNDRGLRLTSVEMLKGFLLSGLETGDRIQPADGAWNETIHKLNDTLREGDAVFTKAWLRGRHAQTVRKSGTRGTMQMDWELIGQAPHRWVRDNGSALGLTSAAGFQSLLDAEFHPLAKQFVRLVRAGEHMTAGLQHVRYVSSFRSWVLHPLVLSAIESDEPNSSVDAKADLIARFLEQFYVRRIANYRALSSRWLATKAFTWAQELRGRSLSEIEHYRHGQIVEMAEEVSSVRSFGLHMRNGSHVKHVLARLIAHVEQQAHGRLIFDDLMRAGPGYEIEHIIANHPGRHQDEWATQEQFDRNRNRIGALLLLPKTFNASYGDDPYSKKRGHYFKQNALAASLHPDSYSRNPGFVAYLERSGLPFQSIDDFDTAAIDQRDALCAALAYTIWDSSLLVTRNVAADTSGSS